MLVAVFDIETGAAEELHSFGPGYVRLCGWQIVDTTTGAAGPVHTSADPSRMLHDLMAADAVTGHNIIDFDLIALAKYAGADYERLARKAYDTIVVERHLNPVAAKGAQPRGYYGLDATAARYGASGKSTVDFEGKRAIVRRIKGDAAADRLKQGKEDSFSVLKVLAALYGGYHLIPQDDPDYVYYLEQDVTASAALFLAMVKITSQLPAGDQRYIRREHMVQASMGRTTLEGFRVDVDETMARWSAGQQRLEAGKQRLHETYGMPLEGRYPHRTNAGKAAFRAALLGTGISEAALDANWPMGKDGSLLTGKDVLTPMAELFDRTKPEAAELCRIILAMNGERTVYGTIMDHTVQGRVHPSIKPEQSSGRWSMKDPGLTVMGKRGGKAVERAVMLADEGDVLVAIDGSQIDARMVAAMSQDKAYMAMFRPGVDLHNEVADMVFGRHDGEWRTNAKVASHGWSYGMGIMAMVRQLGITEDVARKFDRGMSEAFPRLCEWKDEMRAAAGALAYGEQAPANDTYRVLVNPFGRKVRVERDRAYTQATALLGQSATRDGMAEALLTMEPKYRRRVRAVIHDEFVISIPRDGAEDVAKRIAESMSFTLNGVDINFDVSDCASNWSGCYGC